jgi:hypothetical protein
MTSYNIIVELFMIIDRWTCLKIIKIKKEEKKDRKKKT